MATTRLAREGDRQFSQSRFLPGFLEARLGRLTGLTQFGVNVVRLAPGARSSSRHWHEAEDEFVYVLKGTPTLIDEFGRHALSAGDACGFPAGEPNGHHLLNDTAEEIMLLVVGSRRPGEETIHYPDDDFGPIRK